MTLREIAQKLEAVERKLVAVGWYDEARAIELLRLDIERHVLKTEGRL